MGSYTSPRRTLLPLHTSGSVLQRNYRQVVSGLAFCASSAAMILLNKAAMSTFNFSAPCILVLFQCSVTPVLALLWCTAGFHDMPKLEWQCLVRWLPVNFFFSGMIWTSFLALADVGVATVTVLKNLTNFLVIIGDLLIFNKTYPLPVWTTLFLMLISAICSGATDLEYSLKGYLWQMVNNIFTAGYSLYLRWIMTKMESPKASSKPVDEFGMVMYNNIMSIPMLVVVAYASGEFSHVLQDPVLYNPKFQAVAAVSGFIGFLISLSSMWFLSSTTATIFSLVGSLNKIPMAALGMLIFGTPVSSLNLLSVTIGLGAGVLFVYAKAVTKETLPMDRQPLLKRPVSMPIFQIDRKLSQGLIDANDHAYAA